MPPAAHLLLDVLGTENDEDKLVVDNLVSSESSSSSSSSLPILSSSSSPVSKHQRNVEPPPTLSVWDLDDIVDESSNDEDDYDDLFVHLHIERKSDHTKLSQDESKCAFIQTKTEAPSRSNHEYCCSKSTKTNKSPRRKVHFPITGGVKVYKTIHVFDYTDKELAASFYSHREMRIFKRESRKVARLVDAGTSSEKIYETCGTTTRGIETATSYGSHHRRSIIAESIHCVLSEQAVQYDDCRWNPLTIANLYCRYSEPSLQEAYFRGLNDQREALEQYQDDDDSKDPTLETSFSSTTSTRNIRELRILNL